MSRLQNIFKSLGGDRKTFLTMGYIKINDCEPNRVIGEVGAIIWLCFKFLFGLLCIYRCFLAAIKNRILAWRQGSLNSVSFTLSESVTCVYFSDCNTFCQIMTDLIWIIASTVNFSLWYMLYCGVGVNWWDAFIIKQPFQYWIYEDNCTSHTKLTHFQTRQTWN